MKLIRLLAAAASAAIIMALSMGCGEDTSAADEENTFRRLASEAVALYGEIEPLRSSRLGIASSDSLLFTYSAEEIEHALKRLKRLETRFSRLSASRLSARNVERAAVMIHWLRAESFALGALECQRSNPLLYCGIAEEALWIAPSRFTPPAEGELEAYLKRIRRIPHLFANAGRLLHNPAEWHLRQAIASLDSLDAGLDELAAAVEKRYGVSSEDDLAPVRESIHDFRAFAADVLLPVSHGKLILGSENLSKLMLYDEILNLDQNVLVAEAEKRIIQCANEKNTSLRRIEAERTGRGPTKRGEARRRTVPAGGESLEPRVRRLMDELWSGNEQEKPRAGAGSASPTLRYPVRIEYVSGAAKSFAFSPLSAGESERALVSAPLSSYPACIPALLLSAGIARATDEAMRSDLLCTAPAIVELDALRCRERDSIGAVFASETFAEGWRYLAIAELTRDVAKNDPALHIRLMDDCVRQFARMIVVFGLHAGTLTSEGARRYLIDTAGMTGAEAEREILFASLSPSRAYPAIAMILTEQMLKNISFGSGIDDPHRELARILRESRDIPLSLIVPKTASD